jgi:flagellar assembly factor FliW
MQILKTKNFDEVSYDPEALLVFPGGLPGFEEQRRFLALHYADTDPLVYLQSVEIPDLCFVTLPVLSVDPAYRLHVEPEDRERIGLGSEGLQIGGNVLCVAVVSLREDGPTANLLAPIVVNLRNRLAVQAVSPESGYSHQQPLLAEEAVAC